MVAIGSTWADLNIRTMLLTEGWRLPTSLPLKWLCKGKHSVWRKKREKGLPFEAPSTWQNRSTKITKTPVFIRGNHVLWNVCQLSKMLYVKMRKTAIFLVSCFLSLSWLQTSSGRKKILRTSATEVLRQTCLYLTSRKTQHRRSLTFSQGRVLF